MGLTISLLLACFTSLTSFKKTVHQTSMIASGSFRSFLDSRSIMQVTKNTHLKLSLREFRRLWVQFPSLCD
jgi:hypothetical protein